jgi:hypothetical protein
VTGLRPAAYTLYGELGCHDRNTDEGDQMTTPARQRAHLISPRNRRKIARWLRRTARHDRELHPFARRRETLLHYRVAAVETDLLEIAAMLERATAPDPASVAALCTLLADGCDSPLYNAEIHISELIATLHYVRAGLGQSEPPRGRVSDGDRRRARR